MSSRAKLSAILAVVFAFIAMSPAVASADTLRQEVIYSYSSSSENKDIVIADNKFNAACMALGKAPQLLTQEQKSYLSDRRYCPDFCTYADSFNAFDATGIPSWCPAYMVPVVLNEMATLVIFGGYTFESSVSRMVYITAKSEFLAILNGDYPEVSPGEPQAGTYSVTFTSVNYVGKNTYYSEATPQTDPTTLSPEITFQLDSEQVSALCRCTYLFFLLTPFDKTSYGQHDFNLIGTNSVPTYNFSQTAKKFYATPENHQLYEGTLTGYSGNVTLSVDAVTTRFSSSRNMNWYIITTPEEFFNQTPADPDGDWPEDPETPSPTPPPLPEPGDDPYTPDDPDPRDPPTWPEPDFPPGYQPTDLTDILSYLKAINDNLIAIIDDLEDGFNDVITSFQHLYRILDDIDGDLETHCGHLRQQMVNNHNNMKSYLKELFDWLADEIEYLNSGYDDSSVVYWLRRIYNKDMSTTYRPNPVSDPDGFFEWLQDVIGNMLADLVSLLPTALIDAIDTFTELTHFFPVSIPWDIAAILALLAHDPVIPVFDIPFPWAVGHVTSIHIDLTLWDPVAQMVRPVVLVYFCFRLALISRDLLGHLYDFGGDK